MNSTHPIRCSFQLLRYVPDPVRNEFVHIGVLLRDADGAPHLRCTRDWRRVRCLDPDADTALLEGMESELKNRLAADPEGRLRRILEEALSLSVQITEPKAYLAPSIPAGLDELMRLYVDPPPRERVTQVRGRAAVLASMRGVFEQAGVWELMRKQIRAAQYTRPGDPLRIDAGYRPNGIIRMFHAVSLDAGLASGVESAKILAFSAAALRAGVERIEKAALELTAIVEPAAQLDEEDRPERLELYRFGVETMEEHSIRVLTTADLPRLAATARRELHVE